MIDYFETKQLDECLEDHCDTESIDTLGFRLMKQEPE